MAVAGGSGVKDNAELRVEDMAEVIKPKKLVIDGEDFVDGVYSPDKLYKVLMSLFRRWFRKEGAEVYIASPFVDNKLVRALRDIVKETPDGKIIKCFIRKKSFGDLSDENKKFLTDTCITSLCDDTDSNDKKYFHSKYYAATYDAGHKDGKTVELLVSSANFTDQHLKANLGKYIQRDSLVFLQTTEKHFEKMYVKPIKKLIENNEIH